MDKHIINICKIGKGSLCCKYLVMGRVLECMKLDTVNKKIIDEHVKNNRHLAQGDNCEGKEKL